MSWKENLYRKYLRLAGRISSYQEYSLTKPFLKGKVLDIGCGRGEIVAFVPSHDYVGIEIVEQQVIKARKNFPNHTFHLLDCTDREKMLSVLGEKRFDTILLLTLLEFIPDPELLIRSCNALLKNDGRLIITTPSSFIGKIHGYIYKKANSPISTASYLDKKTIKEFLHESFTIERFKSYNLGLSYFVVARPKTFTG